MSVRDTCFVCRKKDGGVTDLCGCDASKTCGICRDQLTLCQDCAVSYCGECFHKPEHSLCTPPEQDHPDHKRIERRWCRLCLLEARLQLLGALLVGPIVGAYKRGWAEEGWPEVRPDPVANYCYDKCNGRGWHWAGPLRRGLHGNLPFVCCCTLEVM